MRKIQKYRGAVPGVIMAVLLSGCSVLTENQSATPDSVLMTKPLKVDLKPDFRTALEAPKAVAPVAPPPPVVPPPAPLVPKPLAAAEKKSSCGNEPAYTLNGRSYKVLPSANGYRDEGMASRYSAKYQGSATAGCEQYDLHAFTAAHRTLPLPSFVRVTNLQNDKSVIVKVNDRGPFDDGGLIRLSSAASGTLGLNERGGKGRVRVETVQTGGVLKAASRPVVRPRVQPRAQQASAAQKASNMRRSVAAARRAQVKQPTPAQAAAIKQAKRSGKSFFVVVKNYDSQMDALDMFVRLTSVGLIKTEMASAKSQGRNVHQVRVGPLYTQDQIDSVKDTLSSNGLATFKVVEIDQ